MSNAQPITPNHVAEYMAVEYLRGQQPITIRAIRPEDKELLREAFEGLEESTIRQRFFGPKKQLTDEELVRATEIDFDRNVALVVCVPEARGERIIGVGRYIVLDSRDIPSTAEIAFLVEEDYQNQGLASNLLKHLMAIARGRGLSRFVAEVLPTNKAMLRVFERSGLRLEVDSSNDSVHVTMFLNE